MRIGDRVRFTDAEYASQGRLGSRPQVGDTGVVIQMDGTGTHNLLTVQIDGTGTHKSANRHRWELVEEAPLVAQEPVADKFALAWVRNDGRVSISGISSDNYDNALVRARAAINDIWVEAHIIPLRSITKVTSRGVEDYRQQ